MKDNLAQTLMEQFADSTGLSGIANPRRYLWTDAFAVCNYLGLWKKDGNERYLELARKLVDQVHQILGRHRNDDSRQGWISGLSEKEGKQHPTYGGLRIGKKLNERGSQQPVEPRLEWDRDGQYFHYLTKWMHALSRMGEETDESCYRRWAAELATSAHRAFVFQVAHGSPKRIYWKMSIDLTRPLVSSMGQHDPLDGLITYLELKSASGFAAELCQELSAAIADMDDICAVASWATDDPLGIGGLLDNATRLAQLIYEHNNERHDLLRRILNEAKLSLQMFDRSFFLSRHADQRLPFRELGLSIGIQGIKWIRELVSRDRKVASVCDSILSAEPTAKQIEAYWGDPTHRLGSTWKEHEDINSVMLATSLLPMSYQRL